MQDIIHSVINFAREHFFLLYFISGLIFWYASAYLFNIQPLLPDHRYRLTQGISLSTLLFNSKFGRWKLVITLLVAIFIMFLGTIGLVHNILI